MTAPATPMSDKATMVVTVYDFLIRIFDGFQKNKPAALASLLNLVTAMKAIQLPSKSSRFRNNPPLP